MDRRLFRLFGTRECLESVSFPGLDVLKGLQRTVNPRLGPSLGW